MSTQEIDSDDDASQALKSPSQALLENPIRMTMRTSWWKQTMTRASAS